MSWHKQNNEKPPCVECRKKRIRCQRPLPCQNCVKNGLAAACLQGSIVKGTRSLKPSSIALHEDMAQMSLRQHTLEKAIAELQSTISSEPHPLLVTDSQIRTASPVPGLQRAADVGPNDDPRQVADTGADELVAALGMMSIRNDGNQFHGDTATSEYLLRDNDENDGQEPVTDLPAKRRPPPLQLPPELVLLSALFPFPPRNQQPPDMDAFLHFLPTYERALQLVHNYHSYYAWCTMLAPTSFTFEAVIAPFYPDGTKLDSLQHSDAHHLALLFMVCLLGTLYDLDEDIMRVSREVEEYHSLARAALSALPVTDHPSVQCVQTMVLMIWYFRLFPQRRPASYQWALSGVLARVVQSLGLHRDCSATVPDPNQRAPYEQTFWEWNCLDIWQSFMFGRPTSMVSSMIDCKRPFKVDVPPSQNPDFFPWKYSFTQLVSEVMAQTLSTTPYADVLKHEKRLKAHHTPRSLAWPPRDVPLPSDEPIGKIFQRYIASVWRNVSVMYIHRRWMVDTILKYKDDPMKSPYWGSVIAAYENARALVNDMRRLWLAHTRYIERMAPFWSHTVSATLVLCALVSHLPSCSFAEDALQHIDETCEMFADAKESLQPPNSLPALRKHQRQCRYAFSRFHNLPELGRNGIKEDDIDMSLSPSETQFPFAFGDSPPQMASAPDRPAYGSAPGTGFSAASTNSDDNNATYGASTEDTMVPLNHAQNLLSSSVMHGPISGYGAERRPGNAWGQIISQMAMQC